MKKYQRLTKRFKNLQMQPDVELNETVSNGIFRLAELEDKIENGTLKEINFPCYVNDTVFVIRSKTGNDKNCYIFKDKVKELSVSKSRDTKSCFLRIDLKSHTSVFEWNFDKVFLREAEAKAKLKELQNERY